ncbi:MAG: hypothetical protein IJQ02_04900 [Oscillospiraceae bacterium]|nr:hypothetical protein [Oscillospiraceae bacterium]
MRRMAPVKVIFHFPKTEEGNKVLAMRVAEVHANAVIQRIKDLDCSRAQKLELLDAIIESKQQTPQPIG